MYIYGRNAVIEALNSGKNLEKIFLMFGANGPGLNRIYSLAKSDKIPVVTYDKNKFIQLEDKVLPQGVKAQGVIALIRPFDVLNIEDFIDTINIKENPVVLLLDEITDPQNLGAIARSAECSGVRGIILPERNSAPITPVAIKVSAGALEHIPVVKSGNLITIIDKLKEAGFWIVGTDMQADHLYYDTIYDKPIALIIGSEGKGMRQSIRKHCDILIKIPMSGQIQSLNASVAAGIVMFEIAKQKIEK